MNRLMPDTTTSTEIQRNFKKVAARAKKLKKPLVVLSNNKPEFIIMDHDSFGRTYGVSPKGKKHKKTDFSKYAGTWTKEEATEFDAFIEKSFEQIDWEMWK
jgi:tricorn protease-like protein